MNPILFNNQLFNPQYVNPQYYQTMKNQIEKYESDQNQEIMNAVKAIHDLCEAGRKIDAQHQQAAFNACLFQLAVEMNW